MYFFRWQKIMFKEVKVGNKSCNRCDILLTKQFIFFLHIVMLPFLKNDDERFGYMRSEDHG